MRSFTVPFNIDTEDKIIGGYISLRQLAWLALGLFITIILLVLNKNYLSVTDNGFKLHVVSFSVRIIISVIIDIICALLAFIKITEITADSYMIKMIKFKLSKHIIKN